MEAVEAVAAAAEPGVVGRVLVLRGAVASESHLLGELGVLARAGVDDPSLLRKPVLVIAPSRSLREHLSARLVEQCGRAVTGISIQTLDGLVASILARAGESSDSDNALLPALIRQLARSEVSLRDSLDALSRGYAPVVGEVTDLLDAGLESAHEDAVIELIGEASRGALAKRAAAVVRVAARASEQLEVLGIAHLSTRVRRACELIDGNPTRVLPARAVFVFGYADATGLQMDLIEMLLRRCGACVYLDHPADPDNPASPDPGVAFSDRFSARMRGAVGVETLDLSESASRARVRVLRAPGLEAEVRGVANRVREALDTGVKPERVGVVTRNLDLYRSALRIQFGRLGIPISGIDPREVVEPAVRRRILALQALLLAGRRASVDLWLDLVCALPSTAQSPAPLNAEERSDLRVAFHGSGVARLADVARLEAFAGGAPSRLPRRGLALSEDGTPFAPRRELAAGRFAVAASAARRASEHLATWPERAALSDHLGALESLVVEHLCWPPEDSARTELLAQTEAAGSEDFELDREDFWLYFDARTAKMLALPIGGAGGGVAVLSVEQARSRTFERLFLIGLSREVFPRPIGEAPLLPDSLRRSLRAVLPDLPVKREGYDEERYLFAQLLSSSPNAVVSHPVVDEDGRRRPASPLLERLRATDPEELPGFWQPAACAESRPLRTACEHAQIAGLSGTRNQFARALRVAVAERSNFASDPIAIPSDRGDEVRAAARISVLEEWDPRGDRRFELGPYYGFLGPITDAADPRRAPLYVTGIEKVARCPWQAVLGQLLRVEPLPDALADLPSADALIVGNLVHGVLQEIVAERLPAGGRTLEEVAARDPVWVPWPDRDRLRDLLDHRARTILRDEGISTPGFERALVERARDSVESARDLDWPAEGSDVGVIGVEVEGVVALRDCSGADRELRFRADRIDRVGGVLRSIDYKTGKALTDGKKSDTRRRNLLKGVSGGAVLQVPAYAMGGAQAPGVLSAQGRYLYLGGDTPEYARIAAVDSEDSDFSEAFERVAQVAFEAWDRGSFTPRLIDASNRQEPQMCRICSVKEACLRGDSGSRHRFDQWVESAQTAKAEKLLEAERAALRLWSLGVDQP
jgi:RecB family exonuclease